MKKRRLEIEEERLEVEKRSANCLHTLFLYMMTILIHLSLLFLMKYDIFLTFKIFCLNVILYLQLLHLCQLHCDYDEDSQYPGQLELATFHPMPYCAIESSILLYAHTFAVYMTWLHQFYVDI